jgi:hypothetical protein
MEDTSSLHLEVSTFIIHQFLFRYVERKRRKIGGENGKIKKGRRILITIQSKNADV